MLHPIEIAIGYVFRDPQWLSAALRHRSMRSPEPIDGTQIAAERDNERLEFLGDAVLDLAIRSLLFRHHKTANEGMLTRWRSFLASRSALARIGRNIGLLEHIERMLPPRTTHAAYDERILANAFEALMGAVYWDGGFSHAAEVAERLLENALTEMDAQPYHGNYKTALQEFWQGKTGKLPHYLLAAKTGSAHAPHFEVHVRLGKSGKGIGFGWSKREASQNAAKDALKWLHADDASGLFDPSEFDSHTADFGDTLTNGKRVHLNAGKERPMELEYLTVREAAELLRVTPQTVRRWIGKGKVASVKIGTTLRIPMTALENAMLKETTSGIVVLRTDYPYCGKTFEERKAYADDLIRRMLSLGDRIYEEHGPPSRTSVEILRELREERLDRIEGKRRTGDA